MERLWARGGMFSVGFSPGKRRGIWGWEHPQLSFHLLFTRVTETKGLSTFAMTRYLSTGRSKQTLLSPCETQSTCLTSFAAKSVAVAVWGDLSEANLHICTRDKTIAWINLTYEASLLLGLQFKTFNPGIIIQKCMFKCFQCCHFLF